MIAAPALAANVEVTLKLSAGRYEGSLRTCALSVPAGVDGLAVMDAAVASGCIESYETTVYPFGEFLECIDGICGAPWRPVTGPTDADSFSPLYWEMFENGECTSYGPSLFAADAGDELAWVYTTWATGFVPGIC